MKNLSTGYLVAGFMLAAAASTTPVDGETLPITPGLWKVTTNGSMMPAPQVEQSCMKEPVFDPVRMMGEEDGCDVFNETRTGNTVGYDVACMNEEAGGKAEGHFSFTIEGDQGSGQVDLTMTVGEQSMDMQYTLAIQRIGDC